MMRSFDVFFDLRLNKRLSNNGETGDLRRHCSNYDVAVMLYNVFHSTSHISVIPFQASVLQKVIRSEFNLIVSSHLSKHQSSFSPDKSIR